MRRKEYTSSLRNSLERLPPNEQSIYEEVRSIANRAMHEYETGNEEPYNQLMNFASRLKQKYQENDAYALYTLYHALSNSTPPANCTQFDFPASDSITVFANKLFPKPESKKVA